MLLIDLAIHQRLQFLILNFPLQLYRIFIFQLNHLPAGKWLDAGYSGI